MKCPGQDLQYWKPGAIYEAGCPRCGRAVEFFKDDTARTCPGCGHRFVNPQMDFGCAAYCPFAEQCLGTLPEGAAIQREALLKDRVAVEMKRRLGKDFKRIGHSGRVARHAERIGAAEAGPLAVILPAALPARAARRGGRDPARARDPAAPGGAAGADRGGLRRARPAAAPGGGGRPPVCQRAARRAPARRTRGAAKVRRDGRHRRR